MRKFFSPFKGLGQYLRFLFITGIGRADVVVKMKDAIYVFEFKFDGTPEEALAQVDSNSIPFLTGLMADG